MCMFCGVADPSHDQAIMGVVALVVGGGGGLLVPWHLVEEPVRKVGHVLRGRPADASSTRAINPSNAGTSGAERGTILSEGGDHGCHPGAVQPGHDLRRR